VAKMRRKPKVTIWRRIPRLILWVTGVGLILVLGGTGVAVWLTVSHFGTSGTPQELAALGDDAGGAAFATAVVAAGIAVLALREAVHLPVLAVEGLNTQPLTLRSKAGSPVIALPVTAAPLDEVKLELRICNTGAAVARNVALQLTFVGFKGGRFEGNAGDRWVQGTDEKNNLTAVWRGDGSELCYVGFPLRLLPPLRVVDAEYTERASKPTGINWDVIADGSAVQNGSIKVELSR
jgi:hypothetical protein